MSTGDGGVIQHIIDVDFHCASEQWAEHLRHQPLIGSPNIFQAERHHIVTVESMGNDERCLFRVRGVYGNLVVSREGI